jgi:hypothetical protein
VKPPQGDRLQDAIDLFHNDSWDCPGGRPVLTVDQTAHLLAVWESWYREEFTPRRLPPVPKEYRKPGPKPQWKPARAVTSSRVPARIREAVLARDDRCCQLCGVSLYGRDYSLQHRDARGMGGSKLKNTMANLVALCGTATTGCHGHVESQPLESDRYGWSVPNGADPGDWPVHRFGVSWQQPGDGWVKAEPHPRQIEMGAAA